MLGVRGLLAAIWLVGGIAAFLFAQYKHIPAYAAIPIAVSLLVEISLYVTMERSARWPAWLLYASALAPLVIYTVPTQSFGWKPFVVLAALAAVAVRMLAALPRHEASLLVFLTFMAAVYLMKAMRYCYPDPFDVDIDILGKLMWIRVGIASVLRHYPSAEIGFGLIPDKRDWVVGAKHFAMFLPAGLALGIAVQIGTFGLVPGFWYKALGAFVGVFFTVALAEEFFFRGILQPRLTRRLGVWAGIILTSVLFGLVHLWFANRFPNWKQVAVATALGIFCGRAYAEAKTIRASMVAHALAVGAWRALFS